VFKDGEVDVAVSFRLANISSSSEVATSTVEGALCTGCSSVSEFLVGVGLRFGKIAGSSSAGSSIRGIEGDFYYIS
jgi:hypothetical protein